MMVDPWFESGKKRALVLVVDDDGDIRSLLRRLLERAAFDVVEASSGVEALRAFNALSPDLVVLDISMPGMDGWRTLDRIRDVSPVPVLMLTARTAELEKVRALRAGADDYLTKPFGRQEVLARVEALLRRARPLDAPRAHVEGRLRIDLAQRVAYVDEEDLRLTPLEFRLLSALVAHAGQVVRHERLLELVWGGARGHSRDNLKLYVSYLRRKLGTHSDDAAQIETVPGLGYRYRAGASSAVN